MFKQLYKYIVANILYYLKQFVFRPENLSFANYILRGLENKLFVTSTLINLTQAFDVVLHSTLLVKLDFYGIRNEEHNMMLGEGDGGSKCCFDDYDQSNDHGHGCLTTLVQRNARGEGLHLIAK